MVNGVSPRHWTFSKRIEQSGVAFAAWASASQVARRAAAFPSSVATSYCGGRALTSFGEPGTAKGIGYWAEGEKARR